MWTCGRWVAFFTRCFAVSRESHHNPPSHLPVSFRLTLGCSCSPFYDESIAVLTEKVARGYYTFLSPWWDEISASAKDLITHLLCVDPAQRYTIDEFLAHPWCNEQPPPQSVIQAQQAAAAQQHQQAARSVPLNAPMDSPLLASMRGPGAREGRSPGLASLKEAFDVANSVHRMEEEGARRRAYNGPGGAGPAGFLQGLNEDDEEAEEDEAVEEVRQKHGDAAASEVQQRKQQQTQQQADKTRQQQQYQAGNQGGYQPAGGADRKMAEAALYDGRAGSRDRGRSAGRGGRGGFELDMSTATLREFSSSPRFSTSVSINTPTDVRFSVTCVRSSSQSASEPRSRVRSPMTV